MSPTSRNRVEIMHGANLDVLGRRDPTHYARFTLAELEHRIRRWARELDLDVAGEGERRVVRAVRLRAQPDHVTVLDVQPALVHQPRVDRGVEEGEVAHVVDVAVRVVVVPARGDAVAVRHQASLESAHRLMPDSTA